MSSQKGPERTKLKQKITTRHAITRTLEQFQR